MKDNAVNADQKNQDEEKFNKLPEISSRSYPLGESAHYRDVILQEISPG
jgi:hypothetical protein